MSETLTIEMTTRTFGLGAGRASSPTLVTLSERTLTARALIAEYVRAEVAQMEQRQSSSLALHYMLADDLRARPSPPCNARRLNPEAEVRRAWNGLKHRRFMLVVDGVTVDDLDTALSITERSRVSFVRLLPLVGG